MKCKNFVKSSFFFDLNSKKWPKVTMLMRIDQKWQCWSNVQISKILEFKIDGNKSNINVDQNSEFRRLCWSNGKYASGFFYQCFDIQRESGPGNQKGQDMLWI